MRYFLQGKAEPFVGTKDALVKLIRGGAPDHFSYTATPNSTTAFLDFLFKSGTIKMETKSWKDVWFDNVSSLPGT
jgi:hypothetical protein